MRSLDPEKDEARLMLPRIKIADLMLRRKEDNSEYYFYALFKAMASSSKAEVYFDDRDCDLDDVILKFTEETVSKYKPELGHLYMFISERFGYRVADMFRFSGNAESIDAYAENDDGDFFGTDEILFQKTKSSARYKSVEEEVVNLGAVNVLFCDLASDIIKFISSGSSRKIIRQRISQAMYSNDVLTVVSEGFSDFQNERAIISAMSIPYMNHCTVEADAYGIEHVLNIKNMQSGKLKSDKETCWIPQKEPKPALDGSEPEMKLPAMNEVYRGYLAQVYDVVRSPGTISMVKDEYEELKKSLVNKR